MLLESSWPRPLDDAVVSDLIESSRLGSERDTSLKRAPVKLNQPKRPAGGEVKQDDSVGSVA